MALVIPTLESSPRYDAQAVPDSTDWQALTLNPIISHVNVAPTAHVGAITAAAYGASVSFPSSAGFGQPVMAAPVTAQGTYTRSMLVVDDTFPGTTLNPANWKVGMGQLYTGPWTSLASGSVSVNNGLTCYGNGTDVDTSGCVSSANFGTGPNTGHSLITFPSGGWFCQVNAKMSDTSAGFFPAIWFAGAQATPTEDTGGPPEMDVFEGGAINEGMSQATVNQGAHCDWGGGAAQWYAFSDTLVNTREGADSYGFNPVVGGQTYANEINRGLLGFLPSGHDITTDFVIYAVEYVPNTSVTYYMGTVAAGLTEVFSVASSVQGGIPVDTEEYYALSITPQPNPNAGWHSTGPGTGFMYIAEVQVYSLP